MKKKKKKKVFVNQFKILNFQDAGEKNQPTTFLQTFLSSVFSPPLISNLLNILKPLTFAKQFHQAPSINESMSFQSSEERMSNVNEAFS